MANKYASSDLYNKGVRQPIELDELYRLYGVTDHATTTHNTWYYLDSAHWQRDTPDIATDYNDGLYENGKFFMKDHFASSARTSSWLTIQEHAQLTFSSGDDKHPRLSPVNTVSERPIYRLVNGQEVKALQTVDPVSNTLLYYIHPDYIPEANLGWHTEAELLSLGYAFEINELYIPLNFKNTGESNATIRLNMVGTVPDVSYDTSTDGLSWTPYTVTASSQELTIEPGKQLFFRGTHGTHDLNSSNYIIFNISNNSHIEAYGNVNSLLSKESYANLTSLVAYAFNWLFYNCRSLYKAPLLPATTLGNWCYSSMFNNCSNLTTPPNLPAMQLAQGCYSSMFWGCSKLQSMPNLPATSLSSRCYEGMFYNCEELTTVHDLPAQDLQNMCYWEMFAGCRSLTRSPNILATSATNNSCHIMFSGCTSLNEVHCHIIKTQSTPSSSTEGWLDDVASSGNIYCDDMNFWELDSPDGFPEGWNVFVEQPLCFVNNGTQAASITLSNVVESGGTALTKSYEYSYGPDYHDESTWHEYEFLGGTVGAVKTLQPGEKVYFRGSRSSQLSNVNSNSTSYMQFTLSSDSSVSAYGNINSIVNPDGYMNNNSLNSYGYATMFKLFSGCQGLNRAPSLPATRIIGKSYYYLFDECSNLVYAPVLPKVQSAAYFGYASMFKNCVSLTHAPKLTMTNLSGGGYFYNGMFSGCTNLINPPELPATSITSGTYMLLFNGCTNLSSAPVLHATSTALQCYYGMFMGCISLHTAPQLPITLLTGGDCYASMFSGCTGLTNAPALPATTLSENCYNSMFEGCAALINAPQLPATMLSGSCYRNMFSGCTHLSNAPELPATTLANSCYKYMFYGCTSLVKAPVLPASLLVSECYSRMFYGCTHLNELHCHATETGPGITDATSYWLSNVASSGDFYYFNKDLFVINNSSGIPSGWSSYYAEPLYFTNKDSSNAYISLTCGNVSAFNPEYFTSNDAYSWEPYTIGSPIMLQASSGNKVYIKGSKNTTSSYTSSGIRFNISQGNIYADGNINSVLSSSDTFAKTTTNLSQYGNYCLCELFYNCTDLYSAPKLPSTTLTEGCYWGLFENCTSLVTSPELPSVSLADDCYIRMFSGCTSLSSTVKLPATTPANDCYNFMFSGCRSLKKIYCDIDTVTVNGNIVSYNNFSNYAANWLENPSASGTVICKHPIIYQTDSISSIPSGWNIGGIIGREAIIGFLYFDNHSMMSKYWWYDTFNTTHVSDSYICSQPYCYDYLIDDIVNVNTEYEADGDEDGYIPYFEVCDDNTIYKSTDTSLSIMKYTTSGYPAFSVSSPLLNLDTSNGIHLLGTFGYDTNVAPNTLSHLPPIYEFSYVGDYNKVEWYTFNRPIFEGKEFIYSEEYLGYFDNDMEDYIYIDRYDDELTAELKDKPMGNSLLSRGAPTAYTNYTVTGLYGEHGELIPESQWFGTVIIAVENNSFVLKTIRQRQVDLNVYKVSFIRH